MLAGLLTARDFASEQLSRKDRQRLRLIVAAIGEDQELRLEIPAASTDIERLVIAANLTS